jgi:hypothetical protein
VVWCTELSWATFSGPGLGLIIQTHLSGGAHKDSGVEFLSINYQCLTELVKKNKLYEYVLKYIFFRNILK